MKRNKFFWITFTALNMAPVTAIASGSGSSQNLLSGYLNPQSKPATFELTPEAKARIEARVKVEEETKAKLEADKQKKAAASRARQRNAAKAAAAKKAQETARLEAEAKARAKQEADAKALADAKAKGESAALSLEEAKAKAAKDLAALNESKTQAEKELKALTDTKAKAEADAHQKSIEEARSAAEAKAKAELEAQSKALVEARAEVAKLTQAIAASKLQADRDLVDLEAKKRAAAAELKAITEAKEREAKARAESELKVAKSKPEETPKKEASEPASAPQARAQAQVVAEKNYRRVLNLADAKESFVDFHLGVSANSVVTMYGNVFAECASHFKVSSSATDKSLVTKDGNVGFMITDQNLEGQKCVDRLKAEKKDCDNTTCVSLAKLPESSIQLLHKKAVFVGLLRSIDKGGDPVVEFEHADQKIQDHDEAALRAEQLRQQFLREQKRLENLNRLARCVNDREQIVVARGALDTLIAANAITAHEANRLKELQDRAEKRHLMADLKKRARKGDIEELDDVLSDANNILTKENADELEEVYRIVAARHFAERDFESAFETVKEAQELDELSSTAKARLKKMQIDMSVGEAATKADKGWNRNFDLQMNLMRLQRNLTQEARMCSSRGMSAGMMSGASYAPLVSPDATNDCTALKSAMMATHEIRQTAMQVDQEQLAWQKEWMSAMYPSSAPGMGAGAPGSVPAGVPQSGFPRSPQQYGSVLPSSMPMGASANSSYLNGGVNMAQDYTYLTRQAR